MMGQLRSWLALLRREYLEHRIAFVYFPFGILLLIGLSVVSALTVNKPHLPSEFPLGSGLKLFETGYLLLAALWLFYLGIAAFFYFGDAFSADRRNNAMLFWKSMPASDLKILVAKFLSGVLMFPLLILVIAAASGLLLYALVNAAPFVLPGLVPAAPLTMLVSFAQISMFALVFFAVALLWYAPFLMWVGGLATVFGRWSLPLAFVIPGLIAVVENVAGYGYVPRGGYLWGYLSHRWQFGLQEHEYGFLLIAPAQFDARTYVGFLFADTNWTALAIGLVFTAIVLWLASEYRRRRIS